jgi:predicted unusual protein kinase regulating ubiquinone biosynthesis (AarF/ABC1/UbiB family)
MRGPMPADFRLPQSVVTLIEAGRTFAAQAPSARVPLARLDGVMRPGVVPEELQPRVMSAIERALESTTGDPLSARDVEKQLRAAWGRPPAEVLDEIDLDDPVAVRPHAQTYRGVLDSDAVAVKVARPRVVATTRADMALLDALARPLGAAFPGVDAGPVLGELRERTMDELDLEHEGEVHRRVARGLRRVDGVSVARVDDELTTHDVHVSAWLEGPTLAEPDARPADPGAVARGLVRVFVGAPRAIGLVLANPRANDVVLLPDGGVGLIGPGAARAVGRERIDAWIATLEALRARDEDAFAAALSERLSVLPADAARIAYSHIEAALGPLLLSGPARLDDVALRSAGTRALPLVGEGARIATQSTPDPADMWPLRMLFQLAPVLAALGAEEDWLELGLGALRDGWG